MWKAKEWTILSFVLGIACVGFVVASELEGEQKAYKVGDTVKAFTLKDAHSKKHNIGKYLGEKIVVLDFWNLGCPVSRAYEERLKDLAQTYGIKNYGEKKEGKKEEAEVVFFAIDSNKTNDLEDIKKYAKEHNLPYPVLKDWENKIADKFDARVTPEVFVIGKDKKIYYHGPIDDSQNPEKAQNHYVKNAIEALLNDKKPEVREKRAFGCTIKRI